MTMSGTAREPEVGNYKRKNEILKLAFFLGRQRCRDLGFLIYFLGLFLSFFHDRKRVFFFLTFILVESVLYFFFS